MSFAVYLYFSLALSTFLYWFLGTKPAGLIMKMICGIHIIWTGSMLLGVHFPEVYVRMFG